MPTSLSYVAENVSLAFGALEVVLVNELKGRKGEHSVSGAVEEGKEGDRAAYIFDLLLDVRHTRCEAGGKLSHSFLNKLLILELFSRFHNADNDGLNQVLAVLVHILEHLGCFCLVFRLDGLVQVDANLFRSHLHQPNCSCLANTTPETNLFVLVAQVQLVVAVFELNHFLFGQQG